MDNREIEEIKSFQNFLTKNLHNLLIKQRILGNGRWLSILSTNKQIDWPYFCILLKPKIFFWLICNCFYCSILQLRRSSLHSNPVKQWLFTGQDAVVSSAQVEEALCEFRVSVCLSLQTGQTTLQICKGLQIPVFFCIMILVASTLLPLACVCSIESLVSVSLVRIKPKPQFIFTGSDNVWRRNSVTESTCMW